MGRESFVPSIAIHHHRHNFIHHQLSLSLSLMTSKSMATPPPLSLLALLLLLPLSPLPPTAAADATVYFSFSTLFADYQKMLANFKIFVYPTDPQDDVFTPPLSLFYTSLMNSTTHFITRDPEEAHLFFLPFPPQSTRSLARLIHRIRTSYPFWDRSLGADHFYLSCRGLGFSSSRNVVELKKNAVQISCFPSPAGAFIPHKDVSLPHPSTTTSTPPLALHGVTPARFLGYWRFDPVQSGSELIRSLRDDPQFLIESGPPDQSVYIERIQSSKFCLFAYEEGEVELLSVALAHGCVPVVITDRPIQDLPLMDVIRWSDIALFVGARLGYEELKRVLSRTCESGGYEKMRRLGATAAHHFSWNESPQPYDAFHMVMYQLWLRRHAIRYARWGGGEVA